jgi:putative flippase GtrA
VSLSTLVLRYACFAVIATVANLAVQRLVLLGGESTIFFMAAVGAGTIVGLIIKYILDKRWIFLDTATGAAAHGKKFGLYTIMGVVTTVIFWGTETAFWLIWQTDLMREIGAIIGLSIGYVVKYNLDRRFVFTDASLTQGQQA